MSDKYLSREQICRWDLMTFIFVVVHCILNTPSCTILIPASGPVQWQALLYNTWSSLCDMPTTIIFSWFIHLLLTIAGKPIDNIYMHTGHFSLIWVNYDDFSCNRFSNFIICQHPIWLTFLAVLRMTHRPVWWTVVSHHIGISQHSLFWGEMGVRLFLHLSVCYIAPFIPHVL